MFWLSSAIGRKVISAKTPAPPEFHGTSARRLEEDDVTSDSEVGFPWLQGRLTTVGDVRELIEGNSHTAAIYRKDGTKTTAGVVWTDEAAWIGGETQTEERPSICRPADR